ncbi:MAG TPA: hypothetical protein VF103_04225, partial [Polyangiaceae bacterium]
VRILPQSILGVEKTSAEYRVVVLPRTPGQAKSLTVGIGDPGFPPSAYVDSYRSKLMVAGEGVCYRDFRSGASEGCLVPRSSKVLGLTFSSMWTKFVDEQVRGPLSGRPPSGFGLAFVASAHDRTLVPLSPMMSLTQ